MEVELDAGSCVWWSESEGIEAKWSTNSEVEGI